MERIFVFVTTPRLEELFIVQDAFFPTLHNLKRKRDSDSFLFTNLYGFRLLFI